MIRLASIRAECVLRCPVPEQTGNAQRSVNLAFERRYQIVQKCTRKCCFILVTLVPEDPPYLPSSPPGISEVKNVVLPSLIPRFAMIAKGQLSGRRAEPVGPPLSRR